jgi:hypothetical protein
MCLCNPISRNNRSLECLSAFQQSYIPKTTRFAIRIGGSRPTVRRFSLRVKENLRRDVTPC